MFQKPKIATKINKTDCQIDNYSIANNIAIHQRDKLNAKRSKAIIKKNVKTRHQLKTELMTFVRFFDFSWQRREENKREAIFGVGKFRISFSCCAKGERHDAQNSLLWMAASIFAQNIIRRILHYY